VYLAPRLARLARAVAAGIAPRTKGSARRERVAAPDDRSPAWAVRIALSIALALAIVPAVLALEIDLDAPRLAGGFLWADIRLDDVFSPRVEGSLSRGMPATFLFHAELWKRRGAWFDRLESSFEASVKVRYDVWSKTYRMEQQGRPQITTSSLDSVAIILSRPLALPVARTTALEPRHRYYVVLSVTLKPLSVEDIEEGEGWLSGEVQTKRSAGIGVVTAVPRAVFDAVRNFAGFGDQRARAISREFEVEDLNRER
jgi:hypothetical protein